MFTSWSRGFNAKQFSGLVHLCYLKDLFYLFFLTISTTFELLYDLQNKLRSQTTSGLSKIRFDENPRIRDGRSWAHEVYDGRRWTPMYISLSPLVPRRNAAKTALMWLVSARRRHQFVLDHLAVGPVQVTPDATVLDLGV